MEPPDFGGPGGRTILQGLDTNNFGLNMLKPMTFPSERCNVCNQLLPTHDEEWLGLLYWTVNIPVTLTLGSLPQ